MKNDKENLTKTYDSASGYVTVNHPAKFLLVVTHCLKYLLSDDWARGHDIAGCKVLAYIGRTRTGKVRMFVRRELADICGIEYQEQVVEYKIRNLDVEEAERRAQVAVVRQEHSAKMKAEVERKKLAQQIADEVSATDWSMFDTAAEKLDKNSKP